MSFVVKKPLVKLISCSTQLSMEFIMLIKIIMPINIHMSRKMNGFGDLNLKFPLIWAILVFLSSFNFMLS